MTEMVLSNTFLLQVSRLQQSTSAEEELGTIANRCRGTAATASQSSR